jgi:hypothetical protein
MKNILILRKDTIIYKSISKPYDRESLFDYKLFKYKKYKQCNYISWFALNYDKAEYYKKKSKTATVYEYDLKKNIKLLVTNSERADLNLIKSFKNKEMLRVIFDKTFNSIPKNIRKHFEKYKYMKMTKSQKVAFEYNFAFGHITVQEQIDFIKLMLKLQEYDLIEKPKKMHGIHTIFPTDHKLFIRLTRLIGLNLFKLFSKDKRLKNQRMSLYETDLNVIGNICLLYNYNGYVFLHQPTLWHKKMKDVSEIAIFNPVKNIE